jgi:4-hydroxyphenylpyruvate dioxygenase
MVDADEDGIYCKFYRQYKIDQPCFEIIQRMGAKGFGAGNFKAFLSQLRENSNCEERYKKSIIFIL